MADRLQMSRVPIREALETLETERLLVHHPNRGYFVAKFSAAQLQQLYIMRRLLETELVKDLSWPDPDRLSAIASINRELSDALEAEQMIRVAQLNRRFHEAIFELSPLDVIRREIARLWDMSDSYRALYLAGPSRDRTVTEHEGIIEALRARDLPTLLDALDKHRSAAQNEVVALLGPLHT
jgi:DNA-binding GntR family transcriptional regulator